MTDFNSRVTAIAGNIHCAMAADAGALPARRPGLLGHESEATGAGHRTEPGEMRRVKVRPITEAERRLIRACRNGQSRRVLSAVLLCWVDSPLMPRPPIKKSGPKF